MRETNQQVVCGRCKFFLKYEATNEGQCYFNPPQVFSSGTKLRPTVRTTEKACGRIVPLAVGEAAAVRTKTNPPTHGHVILEQRKGAASSAPAGRSR